MTASSPPRDRSVMSLRDNALRASVFNAATRIVEYRAASDLYGDSQTDDGYDDDVWAERVVAQANALTRALETGVPGS